MVKLIVIRILHLPEEVFNPFLVQPPECLVVPAVIERHNPDVHILALSLNCGHALQHAYGYTPLTVRSSIVPVVNFASRFSWIFIIIGLVLMGQGLYTSGGSNVGTLVFDIGVIAYLVVLAFHLVTLPVEFNASSRALKQMETMQIVDSDELTGAKKVLKAAAMTYVASTAMVIAQLLRLLVLRGRRN